MAWPIFSLSVCVHRGVATAAGMKETTVTVHCQCQRLSICASWEFKVSLHSSADSRGALWSISASLQQLALRLLWAHEAGTQLWNVMCSPRCLETETVVFTSALLRVVVCTQELLLWLWVLIEISIQSACQEETDLTVAWVMQRPASNSKETTWSVPRESSTSRRLQHIAYRRRWYKQLRLGHKDLLGTKTFFLSKWNIIKWLRYRTKHFTMSWMIFSGYITWVTKGKVISKVVKAMVIAAYFFCLCLLSR